MASPAFDFYTGASSMLRLLTPLAVCLSCVSFSFAADEPTLVEKMTISERLSKVNADFGTAMRATGADRKMQALAVATRNETLKRIAESAEAAKSTEHDKLADIYFILQRYEDCLKHARLALKAKPSDYAMRQKVILSLGHQEKADEAVAEVKTLIGAEVAPADTLQYLSNGAFAVAATASMLSNIKNYDEAEAVLKSWEKKLADLPLDTDQLKQLRDRSVQTAGQLRGRMASAKKRDLLIGKPYAPILGVTWLNGSELKPEDLRGKVVLIDFWAVWCGPCIVTFPHLRDWHDKYSDKGLVIVGVTNRYKYGWNAEANSIVRKPDITPAEEDAATAEFVKFHKLKHRIAVMSESELFAKYAVTGIPQAVLIDRQGDVRLIFVGSGGKSAELLEQGIRDALGLKTETAAK